MRVAVTAVLGLAALVALFVISLGVLDQVARLDYAASVTALILCAAAALAFSATAALYPPLQSSITGENRRCFTKVAAWGSVLLPLETFVEHAFAYIWRNAVDLRSGSWWFTIPAQFVVGGLLGIAVAISTRRWRWAMWGIVITLWGMFWVATILFWLH